jgi:hypothetical protein
LTVLHPAGFVQVPLDVNTCIVIGEPSVTVKDLTLTLPSALMIRLSSVFLILAGVALANVFVPGTAVPENVAVLKTTKFVIDVLVACKYFVPPPLPT